MKLQSTRPQTLAYALTDSPVGQLAWITEKYREWTDSAKVPEDAVDRDQMLTTISLYWLTATAGTSAALYYEGRAAAGLWRPPPAAYVPRAWRCSPRMSSCPSATWPPSDPNIVRWTEFDRGGHFAAMEEPDLLVTDIRDFFRQLR